MGHIRAGKFTIHFGPRERRIQLLLLASKVNALVIPEIVGGGGGPRVSNDCCITAKNWVQYDIILTEFITPLFNF